MLYYLPTDCFWSQYPVKNNYVVVVIRYPTFQCWRFSKTNQLLSTKINAVIIMSVIIAGLR